MKIQPVTGRLFACICLLIVTAAAWAEEEAAKPEDSIMRQVSSEPGHLAYDGNASMFRERVETSNGALSISHEDIAIPLHAGRALSIVRSYNSRSDYLSDPPSSRVGTGWTMHLGRVAFPAKYASRICNHSNAYLSNQFDNPMFEMPNGGRKLFFVDKNDGARFITSDNWILYCETNGEVRVKSPDGTTYQMEYALGLVGVKTGFLYPTLITDRNGNQTTITYTSSFDENGLTLQSISVEDVLVEFTYNDLNHQLETISLNDGRYWSFGYEAAGPELNKSYFLTSVTGPEDYLWEYSYYLADDALPEEKYNISRVTTPGGGVIEYQYAVASFMAYESPVAVIAARRTKGSLTAGTWTYDYEQYADTLRSTQAGVEVDVWLNKTIVTGPSHQRDYYHVADVLEYVASGEMFYTHPQLQRTLVLETQEGEERKYVYGYRVISYESFGIVASDGAFLGATPESVSPLLLQTVHTRDGQVTGTIYDDHDEYGHPRTVREVSSVSFPDEQPPVPRERTTSIQYEHLMDRWILGLKSSESTSGADEITRDYDGSGRLKRESVNGVERVFEYDGYGNIMSEKNLLDQVTTYLDYYRGQPRTTVYADTSESSQEINFQGLVTLRRDEVGNVHQYAYDKLGRLTKTIPPEGHPTLISQNFDKTVLRRGQYRETVKKDGFGRVVTVSKEDMGSSEVIAVSVDRDAYGRVTNEYFPNSSEGKAFTYDSLGRLLNTYVGDTRISSYSYTPEGVSHRDGNGNVTLTSFKHFGSFDAQGAIYQVSNAAGKTKIIHNLAGKVQKIYQGNDEEGYLARSYTYDDQYRLVSIQSPESGAVSFGYDILGNLISVTRENGASLSNDHDSRNRPIQTIDHVTNLVTEFSYYENGQIERETRGDIAIDYGYNANSQLTSLTYSFAPYRSFEFTYDYDNDLNLEKLTYPSGNTISYEYDAFKRVVRADPFIVSANYHPSGNKQSVMYGNGRTISYTEDTLRRLDEIEGDSSSYGMHYSYRYDLNQNIVSIADLVAPESDRSMTYDAVNRLSTVTTIDGTRSYEYDVFNNIQSVSLNDQSEKTYDYSNQHLATLEFSDGRDRVFEYDNSGQATFHGERNSSDVLNVGETIKTGHVLEYDSHGNMTGYRSRFGTVVDIVNGEAVFNLNEADTGPVFAYTPANMLAIEQYGMSRTYNLHSREGDLLMSEKDGAVTEHYYFDGDVIATRELACLSTTLDSDGDTIADCDEREDGLDPENPDTDGDGLNDGLELQFGTNPLENDLAIDDDNDGLSNAYEILSGLDFRDSDYDDDGVLDGEEILWNLSPSDASEKPLLRLNSRHTLEGTLLSLPAVDTERNAYLVLERGGVVLEAIDFAGNTLWSYGVDSGRCTDPEQASISGPVFSDHSDTVLLSVCGSLHAYAADTGSKLWSRELLTEVDAGWSRLIAVDDHIAWAFRDLDGLGGKLFVLNADGVIEWEKPVDFLRSLASNGSSLYTASCTLDGVTVTSYSLSGEKEWMRLLETVRCNGEFARLPLSVGLTGEIYLRNDNTAAVLNRDGSIHSTFHETFMDGENAILVGKRGKAYSLEKTGKILAISNGNRPVVHANVKQTRKAALTLLGDGSIFHVFSRQANEGGQFKQLHQLARVSADGGVHEKFEVKTTNNRGIWTSFPPVLYGTGFYYFYQAKGIVHFLNVSTELLVPDRRDHPPWPGRYAGGSQDSVPHKCTGSADSDSDMIPDCYEFLAGLDPFLDEDATDDFDNDGISNLEEYIQGSHPFWADSDGDLIPDGSEKSMGLKITSSNTHIDSDDDGVFDTLEFIGGTSPVDADSHLAGGEVLWKRPLKSSYYSTPLIGNRLNGGVMASGSALFDQFGKKLSKKRIDDGQIWIERDRTYSVDENGDLRFRSNLETYTYTHFNLVNTSGVAFTQGPLETVKYFTNSDGVLTAAQNIPFDTQYNWSVPISEAYTDWDGVPIGNHSIMNAPVINGNNAVSVTAGTLYLQFEHGNPGHTTGRLLDGAVSGSIAVDRFGSAMLATDAGSIYSIHAGQLLWKNTSAYPMQSGVVIGYNDIAYAGDNEGWLRAIDRDGTTLWNRDFGDAISGTPVIGSTGNLYFFAGQELVASDADGYELWRTTVDPASGTSPKIDEDGVLYLSSPTNGLTAVFTGEPGFAGTDWPMEAHDGGGTGNLNGHAINDDLPSTLRITAPLDNSNIPGDRKVRLKGKAVDMEDGDLSDLIEWWKIDAPVAQLGIGRRITTELPPGEHRIAAFVRDSGLSLSSDAISVNITGESSGLVLFTDIRSPATSGQEIYMMADIENLDDYEYKFLRKKIGDESGEVLQDFSDIPVHVIDTMGMNGGYHFIAVARAKADHTDIQRKYLRYWVNKPDPVVGLEVDFINGAVKQEGGTHKIGGIPAGSVGGAIDYQFEYRSLDNGDWILAQDYSADSDIELQLPVGHYRIRIKARRSESEDKPVVSIGTFWVNSPHLLDSVTLDAYDASNLLLRKSYLIEAHAWNRTEDWSAQGQSVEYEFRIRFPGDTGDFRLLREYSEVNTLKLIVPNGIQAGYAELLVLARTAGTGDRPVKKSLSIYVSDSSDHFGLHEVIGEPR